MANKIPVSNLIELFQQMADEHWAYELGACQTGKVDCSGAFVYAYKKNGLSLYQGSNRIARTEVVKLIPIDEANLVPGMIVFKRKKPDDAGYALPFEYMSGSDHNDYYHVGLLDADCKTVLNAQSSSTGFVRSSISQNWSYVAMLKHVDYETSEQATDDPLPVEYDQMEVYAENGKPVKMRQKPSTSCDYYDYIQNGEIVTKEFEVNATWSKISYKGKTGYMMSSFLRPVGEVDSKSYTVVIADIRKNDVDKLLSQYGEKVGVYETEAIL